jgi:hypothetical protein
MDFDQLRAWCLTETQDASQPVIGWTENGEAQVSLVKTSLADYDRAFTVLDPEGDSYEISKPIPFTQLTQLQESGIAITESAYPPVLPRAGHIGKALEECIPRHWSLISVGLVDLTGFSALRDPGQLKALRTLDAAIDYCNQQCMTLDRTSSHQMSAWARASTGDGYYLFPAKPSRVQNLRLLRGMLLLAALSSYYERFTNHKIPLKIAFTIDSCYTYYRSIREPLLPTEEVAEPDIATASVRQGKVALNAIGRATNQLARAMQESRPSQFLITAKAMRYLLCSNVQLAWNAGMKLDSTDIGKTDNQSIVSEMRTINIDDLAAEKVGQLCSSVFGTRLAECKRLLVEQPEYSPSDGLVIGSRDKLETLNLTDPNSIGFSPGNRPFVVKGKRPSDVEDVWNLRGVGFHIDRAVSFGARHVKPAWLTESEFTAYRGEDSAN